MRALAIVLALSCATACAGSIQSSDHAHAEAVDRCARLAEQAYEEDDATIYEASRIFDECVARIPQ